MTDPPPMSPCVGRGHLPCSLPRGVGIGSPDTPMDYREAIDYLYSFTDYEKKSSYSYSAAAFGMP